MYLIQYMSSTLSRNISNFIGISTPCIGGLQEYFTIHMFSEYILTALELYINWVFNWRDKKKVNSNDMCRIVNERTMQINERIRPAMYSLPPLLRAENAYYLQIFSMRAILVVWGIILCGNSGKIATKMQRVERRHSLVQTKIIFQVGSVNNNDKKTEFFRLGNLQLHSYYFWHCICFNKRHCASCRCW
jgi:hypothetical protein